MGEGNLLFLAQNLQDWSDCAKNRAPDRSWLVIDVIILVWSKSPSELGDIDGGSLKLLDFQKSLYKSFGKIFSKFAEIHEFEVVFNYQELYLRAQAKILSQINF